MAEAVPRQIETSRAQRVAEPGSLAVSSEREAGVHRIGLFGELDLATAGAVQDALVSAEAGDASAIVVDLSGLTFIDSTGMRLLVGAAARSDADRLMLLKGPPAVQRVFQLTALEDHLPFAD